MSNQDPSERWREISGEQQSPGSGEPPTPYGADSSSPFASGGDPFAKRPSEQESQQGPGQDPYDPNPYGQGPYGQNPYGADPYGQPSPYGQQGYGAPGPYGYGYAPPPDHPQASTALIVGLIATLGSLLTCGLTLVISPWAWIAGRRAVQEIDASGGKVGGRGNAQTGMVLGVVGSVLLALPVIGGLLLLVLLIIGLAAGS